MEYVRFHWTETFEVTLKDICIYAPDTQVLEVG